MKSYLVGKPLVIGVGNTDCGDDSVGIVTARRLQTRLPRGVLVVEQSGEGIALINLWQAAKASVIYVIDAMRGGSTPGTIWRYEVCDKPLPVHFGGVYSSHSFGLAQAIELAGVLGCLPRPMIIFGIEGACFDVGAPLSAAVEKAALSVTGQILSELFPADPN